MIQAAQPRYNVLLLVADDLRPDLGGYGNRMVQSPHLDRLAAQGLRFDRAYCQEALCNPSRASFLTGLRPETLKVFDLATHFRDQRPDVVTLPQLFKQNGYVSLSIGKIFHVTNGNHDDPESWSEPPWHGPRASARPVGSTPTAAAKPKSKKKKNITPDRSHTLPFDNPDCDDDDLLDGQIATQAIAVLNQIKNQPFFLGVGFHKPHLPFVAPRKYWELYDPKQLQLASNPFLPKDAPAFASNEAAELRRYKDLPATGPIAEETARQLIHAYYACISYTDAQIGRVLHELERLGLHSKTIVIFLGDHGYHLGEQGTWTKRTNWEVATRVPLIIAAPGQKARNTGTEALVELVDLYPTLTELCGLTPPADLEGRSVRPLLEHPDATWKTAAFSIYPKTVPAMGRVVGRAMRTPQYRLVEWTATASGSKTYELYDEMADPAESVNLASQPAYRGRLHQLIQQLRAGGQHARPKP
ncbi:MAG TPA: sulfatase [Verrucomicrobiota bacterium]|nr:sulfatase [Verrucomicrobiota bacterium]HNT14848.1 sulfatase [Verrucomicrobiota bacterium]